MVWERVKEKRMVEGEGYLKKFVQFAVVEILQLIGHICLVKEFPLFSLLSSLFSLLFLFLFLFLSFLLSYLLSYLLLYSILPLLLLSLFIKIPTDSKRLPNSAACWYPKLVSVGSNILKL
jgi:hypothetical protein